jgi:hypothetical protein
MSDASTLTPNTVQTAISNDNLTIREDPFNGREHAGHVFNTPHERLFFIGRLSPSQQKEWLRDHPDRWQTREDFFRERHARAGTDVEAKPADACSTKSTNEATEGPSPAEDEPSPDESATNTARQTIVNPEATNATAADDGEIVIDGRRLLSERRVAEMLSSSTRTLQRWRTEGKGPPVRR